MTEKGYRKLAKFEKKLKTTASFSIFPGIILSEVRRPRGLEGVEDFGAGYLRALQPTSLS